MAGGKEVADIIRRLTDRGYRALPVAPGTKVPGGLFGRAWRPMGAWQDRVLTGAEISALARAPGEFGVCVVTGDASHGLTGVDIDLDDDEQFAAVVACLPDTPVGKRGKKGETLFYRSTLTNSDLKIKKAKVVSILSTGRQTVLPPSIHPETGKPYEWTRELSLDAIDVSELPELTADHVAAMDDALGQYRPPEEERPAPLTPIAKPSETGDARGRAWALVKLEAIERDIAATPQGGRNDTLNAGAYSVYRCVARGWLGEAEATSALEQAGLASGLKLPEIRATLRSARKGGLANPHEDLQERDEKAPLVEVRIGDRNVIFQDGALADADTGEIIETSSAPDQSAAIDDLLKVPGVVGEVTDWIMATARRPNRRLALATSLAFVGTLIGRRCAGPTGSGTHLYVLEIAPTGAGKQHQADCISRLARATGQADLAGPGQFMSMSSVIRFVQDQPLAICCQDEFGSFLKRVNGKRASSHERGISEVLRSLWGLSFETYRTPEWAAVKSSSVSSPALSLVGLSTPDELFSAMTGEDVANGFLNRFLVVDGGPRTPDGEPIANRRDVPEGLAGSLRELHLFDRSELDIGNAMRNAAYDAAPTRLEWRDNTARDVFRDLSRDCERRIDDDGATGAYFARVAEVAVRLATIVSAGIDFAHARVDAQAMEWGASYAMACAEWTAREAEARMAENVNQANSKMVLEAVRRVGMITRNELVRKIDGRILPRDLTAIVEALCDGGRLQALTEKDTGKRGRPKTVYVYRG